MRNGSAASFTGELKQILDSHRQMYGYEETVLSCTRRHRTISLSAVLYVRLYEVCSLLKKKWVCKTSFGVLFKRQKQQHCAWLYCVSVPGILSVTELNYVFEVSESIYITFCNS